jgi:hypothetical protein
MWAITLNFANAPQIEEIAQMPANRMKFVLVNDIAPRKTSTCSGCSRPLERGNLCDLSTRRRYCGIACYHRWTFGGFVIPTNLFELAVAWPKLTFDVTTALFDSARSDNLVRYSKRTPPEPTVIRKMAAPSSDPTAPGPLNRTE